MSLTSARQPQCNFQCFVIDLDNGVRIAEATNGFNVDTYTVELSNKKGYSVLCENTDTAERDSQANLFRFELNGTRVDQLDAPYFAGGRNSKNRPLRLPNLSVCGETKTLQVNRFDLAGLCGSLRIGLTVSCPLPKDCHSRQGPCFMDDDCCGGLMCRRNRKRGGAGRCVPRPNPRTCAKQGKACGTDRAPCCFGTVCKNRGGKGVCRPKPRPKCVKENSACSKEPRFGVKCCDGLTCVQGFLGYRCVSGPTCGKRSESCGSGRPECCDGLQCNSERQACVPDTLDIEGYCYDPSYGLIREGSCKNLNPVNSVSGCCNSGSINIVTQSKIH